GKGWRYDFTHKRIRHTKAGFKTKKEAKAAEAENRKEVKNPKPMLESETAIQTDTDFLALVNKWLDEIRDYSSEKYYRDVVYRAKRWLKEWGNMGCRQFSKDIFSKYLKSRKKVSPHTANIELRLLRALFNFGVEENFVDINPTNKNKFYPVDKEPKYVPSNADIDKVISFADPDTQDYLWTIRETLARVGEINRLDWKDIDFNCGQVVLYTRKKKGGHLTPRRIFMTNKLLSVLKVRYEKRDQTKPWVFWHRYWSKKDGRFYEGPYKDRKKIMKSLCEKAGVKYFRFHSIRHASASTMGNNNIPIGAIQSILGHENRKTTEIYLHSVSEVEQNAMMRFERARENSHTDSHTEQKTP
ncbi:MAG: tyrosine-type recombinase/integrase, partial [Desulfobacterales bacterium]